MRKLSLAMLLCLSALAAGCASARTPVSGLLYTDVQSPNSTNAAQALSNRMGEACATSILGLVGTGDASVTNAAKNGGIKHVTHVDETASSILGVYAKFCTRVYGN